jgi:hypothetical protein
MGGRTFIFGPDITFLKDTLHYNSPKILKMSSQNKENATFQPPQASQSQEKPG